MKDVSRLVTALCIITLFAAMPTLAALAGQSSLVTLSARVMIYAMAAASLNFILGYGGMISFGHAAFFGIGSYIVGILAHHLASGEALFGIIPGSGSMLVTLPSAVVVSGLAAATIGALSLRTGGVQFIMITLAFAQMLFFFFVSLSTYGGEDGIIIDQTNSVPGLDMRKKAVAYYFILGVAVVYFLALWRLIHSSFGEIISGIRQNERRMTALGIATYRYKLAAFILAGMGAGLAGALLANYLRFASPDAMYWTKSGELMIMVILGGVGSFFGPILGAAALLVLEYYLASWTEHWSLLLGIVLLLVVLGTRGGLSGLILRLRGERS